MSRPRDSVPLLVPVCALVAALVTLPDSIGTDDAYITFVHARNLAEGNGLVFNPGEDVLGTTSPLLALLLAGLHTLLFFDVVDVAAGLHVVAVLACGHFAWLLARGKPAAAWAWLLPFLLVTRPSVRATVGMESLLFVATGLLAVHLHRTRRPIALGVASTALCLARPDGVLLVAILFAATWIRERRFPARMVVAAVVAGLPWLVYSWATYGSPVPATAGAKLLQARSGLWSEFFFPALLERVIPGDLGAWAFFAATGTVVAVVARNRAAILVLAWLVLHNGVFAIAGVPAYPWYPVPFLAQALLLGVLGLVELLSWLGRFVRPLADPRVHRAGMLAAAIAGLLVAAATKDRPGLLPQDLRPLHDRYFHLASWMSEHAPREARLATLEVGILGYYSRRTVIDFMGLVTAGVAQRILARTHVDHVMEDFRPEYVLKHRIEGGHEANLGQHVRAKHVLAYALEDCELYLRWDRDEEALAAELAPALDGKRESVLLFADFPEPLNFEVFAEKLRARGSGARVTRDPREALSEENGGTLVARMRGDGSFVVRPREADAGFGARALASWSIHDLVPHGVTEEGARFEKVRGLAFLSAQPALRGPFARVRLRLRLSPAETAGSAQSESQSAIIAWTSNRNIGANEGNRLSFAVPVTKDLTEVVVELPRRRFLEDDVIDRFYLSPMAEGGEFTLRSIAFERY